MIIISERCSISRNIALVLKKLLAVVHIIDTFSATIDGLPLSRHFCGGVCCQRTAGGAETGPELVS